MSSKSFLLIINPAAGKRGFLHKSETIIPLLKKNNYSYQVYHTQQNNGANHLKSYLSTHEEITDLIIMGGDGTINLVLNALPHFDYKIAIISNGTGNDSLKSLHGETNFDRQCEIALSDRFILSDIGICNGQYFINGIGIGFDGLVVDRMAATKKKRKGLWAYLVIVLQLLPFPKWWQMSIIFDENDFKTKVFSITATNGTTFGGGFVMNPNAKVDDGMLDICIFTKPTLIEKLIVLPFVFIGKHGFSRRVNYYKTKSITVSADEPLKAHIDGEKLESSSFEIKIRKAILKVKY